MTCTKFKVGEVTGIVCTRQKKRTCRFCKRAATRLCDGRPSTGRAGTCDVPLCKAHAHTEGERDFCPKCHARPELPFP
jgi:hypothetical protein